MRTYRKIVGVVLEIEHSDYATFVEVIPSGMSQRTITVSKYHTKPGSTPATVNWSALGSVLPSVGFRFSIALQVAIRLAHMLDKGENINTFGTEHVPS